MMKRTVLIGVLGLMVLAIVGFACGGGDAEAPAAAAPAAKAAPAAAAATAVPAPAAAVMPAESTEGKINESLPSIKTALLTYMTGGAKAVGDEQIWGYRLAIDEVNAAGGLLGGRKVVGKEYDEGYGAETVVASGKKALADNAVAVVGGADATTCVPLMEIMKEKLMPFVATTCGSEKVTTEGYHGAVHATGPRNSLQWEGQNLVAANTKFLWEQGPKLAGVFTDSQYCRNVETEIKLVHAGLADPSLELIDPLYFPYDSPDSRVEVTKAVAQDPDVLYFCQWGKQQVVAAVKTARELGFEGPIIVTVYESGEAMELGPELNQNTFGASPYYFDPDSQFSVAFDKAITPYAGDLKPTFSMETAYTATKLMLGAIAKAGSLDSELIRDALYEVSFITPYGEWLTLDYKGMRRTPYTTLTHINDAGDGMKIAHKLPFGKWVVGPDGGLIEAP